MNTGQRPFSNRLVTLTALAFLTCATSLTATAQTVTLAWDAVPDSSVAGYLLYVGTQSGVYSETRDVGNQTSAQYSIGQPNRTYYFAVAAYTSDRVIGDRSTELTWSGAGAPTSPPGTPTAPEPSDTPQTRRQRVPPESATACSADRRCLVASATLRAAGVIGAMAPADDGRLFVVEDARRIRIASAGGWNETVALEDPSASIGSVVLDPAFEANHYVYVAHMPAGADGTRELTIVRYRELHDLLGEPAAIISGIRVPATGTAPFTVDPAGQIYIAVPADSSLSSDSYSSTLLRYDRDGSVPQGSRAMSPIFAQGYAAPVSVTADRQGAELWLTAVDLRVGPLVARVGLAPDAAIWPRIPAAVALDGSSGAPIGIAATGAADISGGRLYLATTRGIYTYGTASANAEPLALAGIGELRSIAASAQGTLYIAVADPADDAGSMLLILEPRKVD